MFKLIAKITFAIIEPMLDKKDAEFINAKLKD